MYYVKFCTYTQTFWYGEDMEFNVIDSFYIDIDEQHQLRISHPLVCNIRTLRSHTEGTSKRPTYADLSKKNITALLPKKEQEYSTDHIRGITFTRFFTMIMMMKDFMEPAQKPQLTMK